MPDKAPLPDEPNVRLFGTVDEQMLSNFLGMLDEIGDGAPLVLELFTNGGDADVARRIALEVRLFHKRSEQPAIFVGKTTVYSAGVTIMAAFPRGKRFLTDDAVLLVHERRLEKQVTFTGPLAANIRLARELLAQLEIGRDLERRGFAALIAGSDVTEDEISRRAAESWYITAEEALRRGLIAGIL